MIASGILCIGSYFLISLSPYPALGLLGCGLCGLSVGIMWPGSFSMASAPYGEEGPQCSHFWLWQGTWAVPAGLPLWVLYPGFFGNNLKIGILGAVLFPIILVFTLIYFYKADRKTEGFMKNNQEQMNCDI